MSQSYQVITATHILPPLLLLLLLLFPLQVMTVYPFDSDAEAIQIANDCPFGLGSSVFSGSSSRACRIASQLEAGMASINDFNATYMCQGLPFGGVKYSGFGRFAGVEGLRALCIPKVCKHILFGSLKYPVSKVQQQQLQQCQFVV